MLFHEYEMVAQLQRQEVERVSREAWKYVYGKKENRLPNLISKLNLMLRGNTNSTCSCEC